MEYCVKNALAALSETFTVPEPVKVPVPAMVYVAAPGLKVPPEEILKRVLTVKFPPDVSVPPVFAKVVVA